MKDENEQIVELLKREFSTLQAVYLFGSFGTAVESEQSDVDIAVLLRPVEAKALTATRLFDVRCALEELLHNNVDLINLRQVNTVLQKEVIKDLRRIYCTDFYAAELFETLTMSFYQKLNEERAGILAEIEKSGRIFAS